MKRFFFPVFVVALIPLLLSSKCAKDLIPPVCFDQTFTDTQNTNATAAGTFTTTKTIDNTAVIKKLTDKGVNVSNVTSYTVSAITVSIPATSDYTFADVSSAELFVNDISIGKLPANATGLSATFSAPSQTDFKSQFLVSTSATLKFVATFKKAVSASSVTVSIPANICYQL